MFPRKLVRRSGLILVLGLVIFPLAGRASEPASTDHSQVPPAGRPVLDLKATADLDALSNAFANVAAVAKPFVVNIKSISSGSELMKELKRRFPEENLETPTLFGTGSGIIIDADGLIVTNNHVIADSLALEVTLFDGRKFRAQVVGVDTMTDVAVIKINASGLTPAVLGDSDQVRVGQIVLAIGSPFRLGHSISHGIISALGRSDDIDVSIDYKNWLQTDAPINPGNSGGPLINTHGEVIGINVAIATDSGGHQGVGFAIPSNTVRRISSILRTGEKVVRGYLGVQIQPVDEKTADAYGLKGPAGVFIGDVGDKSPAARGGLRAEDIVLAIDGKAVTSREQLQEIIAETKPGSEVAMNVWRGGAPSTLRVKIEAQPRGFKTSGSIRDLGRRFGDDADGDTMSGDDDDNTAEASRGQHGGDSPRTTSTEEDSDKQTVFAPLGFDAETMSPDLIKHFRIKGIRDGVMVTRVDPGSEAFACNLRRGMVIIKANDKTIHNAPELRKILSDAALKKGVRLKVSDGGGEAYLVLRVR
jgi:Do/DeqQ family serine protease